jgi:hypothetical protein
MHIRESSKYRSLDTQYQRWDQVPRRSKHHLLIGHTGCEPYLDVFPIQSNDAQCITECDYLLYTLYMHLSYVHDQYSSLEDPGRG